MLPSKWIIPFYAKPKAQFSGHRADVADCADLSLERQALSYIVLVLFHCGRLLSHPSSGERMVSGVT